MKTSSIFIVISILILSSCSHKNEVVELSRDFFTSLSDTTYGTPKDYYPQFEKLGIEAKSDVVDINEDEISEKNDTFTVRCYNNYTDDKGTFKQDSVILYIAKNKSSEYKIFDSKGLVIADDDLLWFGKQTGAFEKKTLNDIALSARIDKVREMMYEKYIKVNAELTAGVKIANWSWETSYSGEAHGEGRIVNTLGYEVSNVKYHVNYYDRRGNFMTEDEGSINKSLQPGERYSFTFWSSNARYPETANLRLEFSDNEIVNIIKSQYYTGKEYSQFINKN